MEYKFPFNIKSDKAFEDYSLEEFQAGVVLLVDKPLKWTSFDVVNKIRWVIRKNHKIKKIKVGHAGTLDPLATGLLIVCVGKETKNIEQYQGQVKEYTGTFCLGGTTPSFDLESAVNESFPIDHITEDLIKDALSAWTGEIEQYPPVFSAVKIDGKRAYESARAGEEVKVRPRNVVISEFEITKNHLPDLEFRVVCSKGTYIRSLANDFGKTLKSGAHLKTLRRTKIGDFQV